LKNFLKHNSPYIFLYLLLLAYVGYILLQEGKVQIHRDMNRYVGNLTLDGFFAYATHLGDGLFAVAIAVICAFKSVRISLYILLSYAGAGIVSYVLKHWVYYEVTRPHFVFQYYVREQLKLIDGVDVVAFHSFPSGHALSAFALFFCLLFVTRNYVWKLLFLVLAILAAYSRVYLSQHWLIDVYVGSIIGFIFAVLLYFVFYSQNKWSQLNAGLNQLLSNRKKQSV
jgi:membrane-associated phospholipid phosphatase